jgi:hypothetical protein
MPRIERDPRFREVQSEALQQGWVVEPASKGHWRFLPGDKTKRPVFLSGSPSDWRTWANFIAEMRRSGFILPKNLR